MGQLMGKSALITGAARGFGCAIARLLAREGADIAIADIGQDLRSARCANLATVDQIHTTTAEIQELGRKVIGIQADVTKADDCKRMAGKTLADLGKIDILCANAGVFTMNPAWEMTEEEYDWLMDVNLKGVWLVTKYIVPHMMDWRYGEIMRTSSRDSLRMQATYAHYCAAKAGVIAYAKALAIKLGPYDINVNAICPTQMTVRSLPPRKSSSPYWDKVVGHPNATYAEFDLMSGKENLFEKCGQPDFSEVAEGVLWLVTDTFRLVTGHALPMDAGWITKRDG